MPHSRQAKKRHIQSIKRRQHNIHALSTTRTAIKKVLKAVLAGHRELAQEAYKHAVVLLDRSVHKHLMHKNKVARCKSRLNKRIKQMA